MRALAKHLTYANVMVTLLAFVVLGGGTALAAFVVNSNSEVAPGTISGHNPPEGDHANLIPESIAKSDLAAGSVARGKIAADAVNGAKVADESLTGADLQDFALTNEDVGVLYAQVNADATIANSSGGVTGADIGTGRYSVDFGRDVSSCAFVATQGEAGNGGGAQGAIIGATDRINNAEAVFVRTKDATDNEVDTAFQLVVVC